MGKSQDLYKKAKTMIPGGTQLLSKRPEMFLPELWPAYYQKAKGCEVWDIDGNKYVDMSLMGIGSCILGYADPDVNHAVISAVKRGSMSTLNPYEEVELTELLLELHPWADMARFTRSGGEAMSVAVRIARAATKKDVVLFCGYHGWHDWYISANLADDSSLDGHLLPGLGPNGVPRALKRSSIPFRYNDTQAFLKLVEENKGNIGVVVLEAIRDKTPDKEFAEALKAVAKKEGAAFVVDEITSGFRLNLGGAHLLYGIDPDIAVFAKGMSNGYPMAAIIGKKHFMNSAQESFISSTYWTERIGPVAAIAAIKKMKAKNVQKKLVLNGKKVKKGWLKAAKDNGLDIRISGIEPLAHFEFKHEKPLVLKTLFTQKMLESGFLATNAYYASFAHKNVHVDNYINACGQSFALIAEAVRSGEPEKYLKGPVCHSGFKRLA